MEFDNELQYLANMTEHLSSLGMPSDIAAPLSSEMASVAAITRLPTFPPGTIGFIFPKTYWVIRNDDLKLMETLWTGIGAATPVLSTKSLTAAAVVGMLAATFKLVHAVRSKAVKLTADQHRLILALNAPAEGSTISELTPKMRALCGNSDLSPDEVVSELEALTKVRLNDGSVVPLVAQDSQGRWSACGL